MLDACVRLGAARIAIAALITPIMNRSALMVFIMVDNPL
jgi:hypothetical protein